MAGKHPVLVSVDWGTTNFRAALVAADGSVLDTAENDGGMRKIASEGSAFGAHLVASLERAGWMEGENANLPVLMAGMIGAWMRLFASTQLCVTLSI
jgi:2-dehydro-3-deoxygalactonokinase